MGFRPCLIYGECYVQAFFANYECHARYCRLCFPFTYAAAKGPRLNY